MKRLAVLCAVLASGLAAGYASSSAGAGGGAMFDDCDGEDCAGYDEFCRSYAYLRSPSTPAAPRPVDRSFGTTGVMRSTTAPRAAPASPASSRPTTTTTSRP